ncbi:hypothetical protein PI124_g24722 [Phytophthora idaei]|nr:hypothetical protein PI125_g21713 [Phytophthora idaei]KAG3230179.1 hypothetical protein PI124_g24722 [Phytophthora idaei]
MACGVKIIGKAANDPEDQSYGQTGDDSTASYPTKDRETARTVDDNVLSKGEDSPYLQDSPMVTPRSATPVRRLAGETGDLYAGRGA